MTITPRSDQFQFIGKIRQAWADGAQNVLARADTGFGKTVCLAHIHNEHPGASSIIAHRQELVGQLSITLARYGLRHNIIASDNTRRAIARAHVEEFGQCYYTPGARAAVASIDTLIRMEGLENWAAQVTLWTCDEGHHLVRDNKWCRGVSLFTHPACKGLLPTATPRRADGKGLGRHADGYADVMVEGPPMRWLIGQGYLTDYKIICPPSDIRQFLEEESPGASGDWSPKQLRKAAQKSHIIGDAVQHYSTWALGKRTLTFCTDVETAVETAARFNAANIPTAVLTGKTEDRLRRHVIHQLERGEIWNICAVDIISEGFDLPAVECIIMARPTESLALFMQQFGRALRALPGKQWAIIIDMVGNVVRLGGPPDRPRVWSLDRRDKRASGKTDGIPFRICLGCFQPYERIYRECPFCGLYPEPADRSSPAHVDGDLEELDAATLARLRGDVAAVDMSEWDYAQGLNEKHARPEWITTHTNRHRERQAAQRELRARMDQWAGIRHAAGRSDYQIQREFFLTFGLSVLEALALGKGDAMGLKIKVDEAVIGG